MKSSLNVLAKAKFLLVIVSVFIEDSYMPRTQEDTTKQMSVDYLGVLE